VETPAMNSATRVGRREIKEAPRDPAGSAWGFQLAI
jgi:hypothetical protein